MTRVEDSGAVEEPASADIIGHAPDIVMTPGLLRRLMARVPRQNLVKQASWVTLAFGLGQIMRLGTNVVLAYLLAPQLFGVMLIVNTLRTGVELLSDIGVGANVISNPRGDQPEFYNTAFTLQVIRGLALAAVVLILSVPLSHLYDQPQLTTLIPLMSILFILSGLNAPSTFLLLKRGETRTVALAELATGLSSMAIHIVLALITQTVWALYLGLVFSTAAHAVITHVVMDRGKLKLRLDRGSIREILSFGKWVFASSIIYFLAMNYDRLYFAKVVPFAVLGVYGVARTFSDAAAQLVQKMGGMLIYPKIAAWQQDGPQLRAKLAPIRGRVLLAVVAGLALAIAGSDRVILTLYDGRYHAAAFMLPILMVGVWFSVLASLSDAVMMGTGRPDHSARANLVKFVFTVIGLPLALHHDGLAAGLLVIASADLIRYASLAVSERAQQRSFVRQDLLLTLALFAMVAAWRVALTLVGIVPDPAAFWALGASLHG